MRGREMHTSVVEQYSGAVNCPKWRYQKTLNLKMNLEINCN